MGRAQRRAVQDSINEFKDFMGEDGAVGTLHKALNPQALPSLDIVQEDRVLFHPRDMIDHEAKSWHDLWAPAALDEDEISRTFARIQAVAAT
eukprot:159872-Pyramimonas_sp.AAC.1